MTTAWAHLPNAVHIDHVLAHAKKHPRKWRPSRAAARGAARDADRGAAWYAAREAAWEAAWDAAGAAAWDADRGADRCAAWYAAREAAWDAARDAAGAAAWAAIAALIAWDEAGDLLSQPIEVAKFLADEGNPAATLLYPAMVVMKKTVDTVNNQE